MVMVRIINLLLLYACRGGLTMGEHSRFGKVLGNRHREGVPMGLLAP
jgi:hypothetical protein